MSLPVGTAPTSFDDFFTTSLRLPC
jgi:hypothetical protein